jgi:molecular chaperone DnaJ
MSWPVWAVKIEVPTIYGKKVKMKIPAGTENDHVFRLKGHGMPYLGSYGKGDQLVLVNIKVPQKLSSRQKELLKELARLGGDEFEPENSFHS